MESFGSQKGSSMGQMTDAAGMSRFEGGTFQRSVDCGCVSPWHLILLVASFVSIRVRGFLWLPVVGGRRRGPELCCIGNRFSPLWSIATSFAVSKMIRN